MALKEGNTHACTDDFGDRIVNLLQALLQGSLQVLHASLRLLLPPAVRNIYLGKQELLKVCCFFSTGYPWDELVMCPGRRDTAVDGWITNAVQNTTPLLPRSLESQKRKEPWAISEIVNVLSSFGCMNSTDSRDACGRVSRTSCFSPRSELHWHRARWGHGFNLEAITRAGKSVSGAGGKQSCFHSCDKYSQFWGTLLQAAPF